MGVVDERNVRNYITGILRRNVGDCQLNLRQAKLTADPKEVPDFEEDVTNAEFAFMFWKSL